MNAIGEKGPQGTIDEEVLKTILQKTEVMKIFEDKFQEKRTQ
ncbi:hypothetical protein [Wolbachia endosymbiont (group B) of Longitarsus flavicornis]